MVRFSIKICVPLLATAYLSAGFAHSAASPQLSFTVTSGGYDNYFIRDDVTSAQILLPSTNNTATPYCRLVVALPAGNTGALTYFLPLDTSTSLSVNLLNGTLRSTTEDFGNAGIQADLSFNANASLGVTIVGAVRAIRDYVEGMGTMHEIFNYTLASYNSTFVRLHRRWINATVDDPSRHRGADFYLTSPPGSDIRFEVNPGDNGTSTPSIVDIFLLHRSSNGIVRVKVVTNETSLVGLDPQELFPLGSQENDTAWMRLANPDTAVAKQVSFLAYKDKFVAGGWRFLTYFGRDTLIALRLLMPTLASDAIEASLGAVIERTNSNGALCHEETIGDYASFINIQNNRSDLGNRPFYDYKMIDTDLLLLPAMSHYFLESPQGKDRADQFLRRNATLQNGTYAEILNRTVAWNIERALPFSQDRVVSNLIGLHPGEPVGNWRDSNEGLGYGVYPFDVNTALVPASLRATQALLNAGVLSDIGTSAEEVGRIADIWEQHVPALFDVTIDADTSESRLQDFVCVANLSDALLEESQNTSTVGKDFSFYALSLRQDGTPVEVLNSDLGFNLLYASNITQQFLQHVIDALQPYPRGLLTNVGMVVANPAYDSNRTIIEVLNRAAYHGTVIWSFQQGLMAGGLARQLELCSANTSATIDSTLASARAPSWCSNSTFADSLRDAQTRLWTSINGAHDEIYSEVWSYSFDNVTNEYSVVDLGSLSPEGTESDAIQLWSYGFLGLLDPTVHERT